MNIFKLAGKWFFACFIILLIGLLIKSNIKTKDTPSANTLNSFAGQMYEITKIDYPQTSYRITSGNDPSYYYVFFDFNERSSKLKVDYILKKCIEMFTLEDMYHNFTGLHNIFYIDLIKAENEYTVSGIGMTMFYKKNTMTLSEYNDYIQSYEIIDPVISNIQLELKKEEGFVGYVDESDHFVIYPQYSYGLPFSEGIAYVSGYVNSSGFIDKSGKFIIVFPGKVSVFPFYDGRAKLKVYKEGGYYDSAFINKRGKIIFECPYFSSDAFRDNLLLVKIGDKWGYLDKQGNVVIEPQFDYAKDFYNGKAHVKKDDRWMYIDQTGEMGDVH